MKPIVRNAILVATLIVLPGCPSQQVLMTPDDRLSLSSQPHIIAIHYPPEEIFRLRYPGEILGGPFATLAAQYEAARLKRDLRLEDPALGVKDRLVNALRANFNITKVRTVSEYPHTIIAFETYMEARRAGSALDVETSRRMLDSTLKETFQTGVVLEVQTRRWMLESARVVYSARARLLRVADSAVIWQGICVHVSEVHVSDVPALAERRIPHPTIAEQPASQLMKEELEANDGKLLKAKLREAADGCADKLLSGWAVGKVSQPNR